MKTQKLTVLLATFMAVILTVFATGCSLKDNTSNAATVKNITVSVTFADKTEKEYKIETDGETLADALLDEKIIEEKASDGLYTVIAGERADYTKDKSWWCVTKEGKQTNVGINDLKIADGDNFEITNTPA